MQISEAFLRFSVRRAELFHVRQTTVSALELTINRAGGTAKAFSNGPDRAQIISQDHDDGTLLPS